MKCILWLIKPLEGPEEAKLPEYSGHLEPTLSPLLSLKLLQLVQEAVTTLD